MKTKVVVNRAEHPDPRADNLTTELQGGFEFEVALSCLIGPQFLRWVSDMAAGDSAYFQAAEVRALRELHAYCFESTFRRLPIGQQIGRIAEVILREQKAGSSVVVPHFRCWHPELVGKSAEQILAHVMTRDDALITMAREYGFRDPDEADRCSRSCDLAFEQAVDDLLTGDADALEAALRKNRRLATQRSPYGHRATLLHYAAANGVETVRQVTPYNLPELLDRLLKAGADSQATALMYGGSTPSALLETSAHPHAAGVAAAATAVLHRAIKQGPSASG